MENGGPAPEGVTDMIYANTKTIKEYFIADLPDVWLVIRYLLNFLRWKGCNFLDYSFMFSFCKYLQVDISIVGITSFQGHEGSFDVDVFDSTSDYVKLMK